MKRLLAFAALPLCGAMPAQGAGWNCSVSDELSPNLPATMETVLNADRNRTTLDFYIWWVPQPRYAANQLMRWVGVPREATLLWKPDRIEFGIPGQRTDTQGFIRFDTLQGNSIYSVVRPTTVRSLRPNFDSNWVVIEDGSVIAQLWAERPRRVLYTDRRGEALGSLDMLLPGQTEAQDLFTRMRAALEAKVADPATHCRALPDAPEEEPHFAG